MKKFLVLYRMDMAEMQKMMASTSAEERKKSMGEWEVWMKKNMASFADHGGPVGKTKQAAATHINRRVCPLLDQNGQS